MSLLQQNWRILLVAFDILCLTWIQADTTLISDAIARNFTQWDDFIGEYIWIEPEPVPETYAEEISYMMDWIGQRIQWMDANLPGICQTTGVGENPLKSIDLSVYPNPTPGPLETGLLEPVDLQILDMSGRVILQVRDTRMDISELRPGVNILQALIDGAMRSQRVVKY